MNTDRKSLIEKAHDALVDDAWIGHEDPLTIYDLSVIVQRVWAVFEQENTPTTDEREALEQIEAELAQWLRGEQSWCDQHHGKPDEIELTARADEATIRLLATKRDVLAAALRRPEVPSAPTSDATQDTEEPEWEYGIRGDFGDGHQRVLLEGMADYLGATGERVRRVKAVPAGPWVPVPVEQEGESRGA